MAMTFKQYLIEVTTDTAMFDDPKLRQDLMRRMRTDNPDQQARMDDRLRKDQMRKQRQELQTEEDPRKKQLLRKKQMLQQQLQVVNDQIAAGQDDTEGAE